MQHQAGLHQCVWLDDLCRKAAMSTWLRCEGMQHQVGWHLDVQGTCKAGQPC